MSTALLDTVAAPRRQAILRLVWDRERSAGQIRSELPDVTFGAVSQHLRRLEVAGAVSVRRDGRRRFYRARREALGTLADWLESQWDDALWRLKIQAEMEEARRGPRSRPRRGR